MAPRELKSSVHQLDHDLDATRNSSREDSKQLYSIINELAQNVEALYVLARLYVALLSLIKLTQGDLEYTGIGDKGTLRKIIQTALRELPAPPRRIVEQEVHHIEALINASEYEQAKARVRDTKQQIESWISRREPPERVRPHLLHHTK